MLFIRRFAATHVPSSEASIILSPRALTRIDSLRENERPNPFMLRLKVDGGGCVGFMYGFEATGAAGDNDVVVDNRFVVDAVSFPLIKGATVDYVSNPMTSSFQVVSNPNSTGTCGCGSSFNLKEGEL